jgi:ribosomal protein L32
MDNRLFESVKRIGFRKWYERQLLSSHAHMVLALLSTVGLVGSMEAFRVAQGDAQMANVMFVLVCAAIALWALRRYMFLLMRAEQAANQASCPDCGEYGRFHVVGHRPRLQAIDVCCKKCSRDWTICAEQ